MRDYAHPKPEPKSMTSEQLQELINDYLTNGGKIKSIDKCIDQTLTVADISVLHKVTSSWLQKQIKNKSFVLPLNQRKPDGTLPPLNDLFFSRKEVDQWFYRKGQSHKSL